MQTITLPIQLNLEWIEKLQSQLTNLIANNTQSLICIDYSFLEFIRPAGVVFLGNLISDLKRKGHSVSINVGQMERDCIHYLDDSDFFVRHHGNKLFNLSSVRTSTIPYRQLENADSHAWVNGHLMPWFVHKFSCSRSQTAPLETCLKELVNNIHDHADLDEAGISAQYYPRDNQIEATVGDFGIGIPSTIRRVCPELIDDSKAIIKAVERDFTSQTKPSNRGAGLAYLMQQIVEQNGGSVTILSGHGKVSFYKNSLGLIDASPTETEFYLQGTLVRLIIRTNVLWPAHDEEEEDLQW